MKKETIYLAGGCFWGTEKYMEMVPGVLSTRVGYALGKKDGVEQKVWDTVTYEEVCNHSGHAETVEVVFDADETTLKKILQDYFYTIDPTSLGRQGADFGIQYRTGIYSLTEEQQKVISLRDRNILVSAAAGSGKTAVLVQRILSKIMDTERPVDIDRLLIMTFTRAAAGERGPWSEQESRLYHRDN